MLKNEIILPYKLEQHLAEICNSNATYANLLSVWNINKKMCQDVLSTVVMNYPHYTKHDISHCEAIITNIEMLLGEDAIKVLSPTDTWLLLHAAYLHDIGMVIECKKIEKKIGNRKNFKIIYGRWNVLLMIHWHKMLGILIHLEINCSKKKI